MNLFKRSKKLPHVLEEEYKDGYNAPFYTVYRIPNAKLGKSREPLLSTMTKTHALEYMEELRQGIRDNYGRKRRVIGEVWK